MNIHRRGVLTGLSCIGAGAFIGPLRSQQSSTVLFSQPSYLDGIRHHFSVRNVFPSYNPTGVFYMHSNQPNPFESDNDFLPVQWDASALTGLAVPSHRGHWQRGMVPSSDGVGTGRTVAQLHGEVVGAFLNSKDLVNGSAGNRMMIAPTYQFPRRLTPFATPDSMLGISLDLQVPTATDLHINTLSNSYVKIDLLFVSAANAARLSLSCGLFANGLEQQHDSIGFDQTTQTSILAARVSRFGALVTPAHGSAWTQSVPWAGWASFAMTMSQAQFQYGLRSVAGLAAHNGYHLSRDPSDWVLFATHLNAELHATRKTPASLGWSMRNLTITQIT